MLNQHKVRIELRCQAPAAVMSAAQKLVSFETTLLRSGEPQGLDWEGYRVTPKAMSFRGESFFFGMEYPQNLVI